MKEQFVDHEIAALLKEKCFKEECMAYYEISIKAREDVHDGFSGPFGWKKGEVSFSKGYFENNGLPDNSNEYWLLCGAPLWQQVIDWFREKHSINVGVYYHEDSPTCCAIIERFTENGLKLFTQPNGEELEFACVDRKFSKGELKKAIKHALTLI